MQIANKVIQFFWNDDNIKDKRKLSYYKNIINPKLEHPSYPHKIINFKKKLVVAKLRTNSHELHSEIVRCTIPKTPRDKRICKFCNLNAIKDETHFLYFSPSTRK